MRAGFGHARRSAPVQSSRTLCVVHLSVPSPPIPCHNLIPNFLCMQARTRVHASTYTRASKHVYACKHTPKAHTCTHQHQHTHTELHGAKAWIHEDICNEENPPVTGHRESGHQESEVMDASRPCCVWHLIRMIRNQRAFVM